MERTTIRALYTSPKEGPVRVSGWVRTLRDLKGFGFIELNDGSFFKNLQVLLEREALPGFDEAMKLGVGSGITVKGELTFTPDRPQPFELRARSIALEGAAPADYPLQKKRHSVEFLRSIAHLRPRTNLFAAVFRIRSLAAHAVHSFFQDLGFVYVHTPLITASDAEGAGEMFRVTTLEPSNPPKNPDGSIDFSQDFFGKPASLTVSGQLNAESFALAFQNVYTFGPTFRAEESYTPRHAAEFWMIEPEIAFADLKDDMALAEGLIKSVIRTVLQKAPDEIGFLNQFVDQGLKGRLEAVASAEFGRVSYTEAVALLEKNNDQFEYKAFWGCDLQTEHERYLSEKLFQKPVFVTDYPKQIKAFYMRANDDGKTVAAMDLLAPGIGELIGGSQREERLERLEARMDELGLNKVAYGWYLDLRRFGGVKHAGFGVGFERLVMYLTGVSNIRDVLPFPRTTKNAEF
ncbi:MAG: asparagine--tRNA ligase [Christensenellaceae bacterium]|jgi:asparaginyl-tRNA synthetase|nr:asparagine--tRNA ligase [Christensenellaceae bacterium]